MQAKDTVKKVDITMSLKGDKTWKDILNEAEIAHPNDEKSQIEFGVRLMQSIGWDISCSQSILD